MKDDLPKTLLHAVSGGVDSSVAAYLLSSEWNNPKKGRKMVCANHSIWHGSAGGTPEVIERARAVCDRFGLPFHTVDLVDVFRKKVVDDFIDTYVSGKTPNPCVRCNEAVRFSVFYRRTRRLLRDEQLLMKDEPLFFSTGHYVRLERTQDGIFLKQAVDTAKDQSYMLYRIAKEMLSNTIFPLGDYTKQHVVQIAKEKRLPSSSVRESQDICFIKNSYGSFIKEHINDPTLLRRIEKTGNITDTEGNILGEHKGFIHYTVGQRRGLNLANGPWYVVRVEPAANTVVVGRRGAGTVRRFSVGELNWFIEPPPHRLECEIKVRYNTPASSGTIDSEGNGTFVVTLDAPSVVTPGQSAVFYRKQLVLGGGIILDP